MQFTENYGSPTNVMEQYKNQVLILLTNIESRTSDKTADKIFVPMVIFSFHQG